MSNDNNAPTCRFNHGVSCWDKVPNCAKCGWNPKVERMRKQQLDKEHTIYVKMIK